MPIHVALHHKSRYTYDRQVAHAPHIIRLRPAPHCRTPILSYSLKISPRNQFLNWQQDPFGNYQARLVLPEKTNELLIEVDLVAEMAVYNPFDYFLEPEAETLPFVYEPTLKRDLAPFLETTAPGPLLRDFLAGIDRSPTKTTDFLVRLNQRLSKDIRYVIRLESGVQTAEETLRLRSGSCRDSGWLLVQVLRDLGLAARFVSGYLIQLQADVKSLDGPSGAEQDFTDLHAWVEVYLPGAGWIGLDPTSGLLAGEGHIPLACTPSPTSAAPVCGAVDECESQFSHEMRVSRFYESPRVTKPYTEEQWSRIEVLGRQLDTELIQNDIRLTMGGEPTFISIDNMDGEEWNFTALSPQKRRLAGELLRRLKRRFAPGGLLHFGQGKWYPGESLPRWALGCYWRKDGLPLWHDESLVADENHNYGFNATHALRFAEHLAAVLGVAKGHIQPGYEDVWHYLWREKRLPVNIDPLKSQLAEPEERERLASVFKQGLDAIVGYAMPLRRTDSREWVTGPWFLRREHLFLIPGDSPMGLRLPMDSLPWVAPEEAPHLIPPDPTAPLPPLRASGSSSGRVEGSPVDLRLGAFARAGSAEGSRISFQQPGSPSEGEASRKPGAQESAHWIVRTCLCVQPRQGCLHVFMPPMKSTEDYLDLVSAVEATADALGMPVLLEGDAPPADSRLSVLKVTPDPGVIEVNLHPAHSWFELVRNTTALYDEAHKTRLGTEKFMIDGRHTGTGGGNHVVLGGAAPSDSPFLRRPDLLRSLLAYWQNHPALSYLFSGMFIGPTSQHPRVDEARHDSLHELEIAFGQIPESGLTPPWLVDRLFRNLLIDMTGNTHRAEFCIDKLYSPDSAAGRLGLLEMRAFEMPPHERMSLAQQLLIRSLVCRFWKESYTQPLVRWGTTLHDRFMLPHFVEEDLRDVVDELREAGYPFQMEWFAPHIEFRFPCYGAVTQRGVHLEIRQALEPWHVLGEQGAAGGTARYVDASLERLQVKVRGMTGSRHVVACNGRMVPLHPTGTAGEHVAGVRFRAWKPPECLQPTIDVHAPLVFDLVDRWNRRSLGGCTYHVAHPGGRTYSQRPVNSYEAESRRLSRFFATGHTPGRMPKMEEYRNPEFPLTLDLRRPGA